MKYLGLSFGLLLLTFFSSAQELVKRIILVGDAGEINVKQSSLLHEAASLVKEDSTLVFFLGDNIYPSGMALEGVEREEGIKSLHSQFEVFRSLDVPVYFMAGNHDWNVSRPGGLERLVAQEKYLNSQEDKDIRFIPPAGEPGPVSINVSDEIVVIAYDSEYWLYPYHPESENLEIARKDFSEKLTLLFEENKDKTVLVLSHHPMVTYGEHSLIFGWKQHVFPLTRIHKNLYIPLPVIGSIFPLWRGHIFDSSEDLPSKQYQELIKTIMQAKGDHPNVLFAAGHDHGLQYIDTGNIKQVVSGSGSKTSFIINHKDLKYKYQQQGFSILDCLDNGDVLLAYYTVQNSKAVKAYEVRIDKVLE